MESSLRVLAGCLVLLLISSIGGDTYAQSRGRTAGRDDDAGSSRGRVESTERSQSTVKKTEESSRREQTRESSDSDGGRAERSGTRTVTRTSRAQTQSRQPDVQTQERRSTTRAPRVDRSGSSDARRSSRTEQAEPARSRERPTPAATERDRQNSNQRTDGDARGRTATSREARQQGDAPRQARERTPSTPAPEPGRTVDREPRQDDRPNTDVRGRDADRAASRGRRVQPPVVVHQPPVVVHPHRVRVNAAWPWEWRRQNRWSPRYRYRQRVIIDAGWLGRRHNDVVEVETTYRHRLRRADGRRAEVDVFIERIALFDRGRFIGEVDRIPSNLARTRAYVYRNGRIRFDRDIFLVGSRHDGFEIISTRHYDGYVLNAYERSHGYRVGYLDFRRGRVVSARRSHFFDPYRFSGHVPLSLLPDDRGWLLDYGRDSITGYYYDSRGRDDDYYDDWDDWGDRGWTPYNYQSSAPGGDRLERQYRREITTNSGVAISLDREEAIERIDD